MYYSEDYGSIPHPPEYWAEECPVCDETWIPAKRGGWGHECPGSPAWAEDLNNMIPADWVWDDATQLNITEEDQHEETA